MKETPYERGLRIHNECIAAIRKKYDEPEQSMEGKRMPMFRGKPITVEAVQLNWKNWSEICEGFPGLVTPQNPGSHLFDVAEVSDTCGELAGPWIALGVVTLNGPVLAKHGDWIIKGEGEYYPCHPRVFEAKYEPADLHGQRVEARQAD